MDYTNSGELFFMHLFIPLKILMNISTIFMRRLCTKRNKPLAEKNPSHSGGKAYADL
jgi:hypothetical protein